jgi:TP901 family phage tail tape measure protein
VTDTSLVFNLLARDQASPVFEKMQAGAAVAGVAIGAALTAGLMKAMEKDAANSLLAAQLGASPAMAKEFGEISGHLYAQGFGENITDVNNALKAVWQNGLLPEDAAKADIEKVTALVIAAAGIMEEETGRVAQAVSKMLRTGMAQSAEEALDIVVRSTQQGLNASEDLLDTLNEYSTQFRKVGLDGVTAMGLVSQALKNGARDSDVAADAVKEFSIRAVDGSKGAADAYKALGFDAKKMIAILARGGPEARAALDEILDRIRATRGSADAATIAFGLFGTQSEDLGEALYSMDLSTAADQLGDVAGAAQKAADTMGGSSAAKFESFKRALEEAFVNQISKALPYLNGILDWAKKHETAATTLVTTLTGLAVVIGILIVAVKAYTAATAIAAAVSAATPFGLIVLAIAAVIAIIVALVYYWDEVKAAFVAGWDAVARFFTETIPGWWDWLVAQAKALPGKALDALKALPEILWSLFTEALNRAAFAVGYGIGTIFRFWLELPGRIWGILTRIPGLLWDLWKWAMQQQINAVRWGIDTVILAFKNLPSILWNAGVSAIQGLINGILNMAGRLRDLAWNLAKSFLNGFKSALGISSPSRVMVEVATSGIGAGLLLGLQEVKARVAVSAVDVADAVRVPFDGASDRTTALARDNAAAGASVGRGRAAGQEMTLVVIHKTPDGRELHRELVQYAGDTGRTPQELFPARR